jgi:hypothetical protein
MTKHNVQTQALLHYWPAHYVKKLLELKLKWAAALVNMQRTGKLLSYQKNNAELLFFFF